MKLPKIPPFAEMRKAVINVTGLAASLVTLGFIHGQALVDVNAGIALATAVLHFRVPNAKPKG